MFSRGLIISLGVSALASTLLFLYFRNKVTSIERKVDVMFDLIQNHQQEEAQHYPIHNMGQENIENPEMIQQMTGAWSENARDERELIQVSDNEVEQGEESDTDCDSEEVSDSDEDDEILEPPKLISLDQGENVVLSLSEVNTITEEGLQNEPITMDNIQLVSAERDEGDSLDEDDDDDDDDDDETQENTSKLIMKSQPEEADLKTISLSNESEHSDEPAESEEEDSIDYTKLKVTELKALAEAKGLSNYKSLKKGPLVELLKTHG